MNETTFDDWLATLRRHATSAVVTLEPDDVRALVAVLEAERARWELRAKASVDGNELAAAGRGGAAAERALVVAYLRRHKFNRLEVLAEGIERREHLNEAPHP